jgi:predicted dehydrogenase
VRFLIAGLGSIGRRHLRNLVALGQRDLVLYRTGRGSLLNEELDGFPTETDLAAALARRPDGVIVSNPTSLHLDVAIPAAEAGCHLLLEKPVSADLKGVDELRRAVTNSGANVLMGFQFRFHPTLRMVKSLVEKDSLGRLVSARGHWGEYLPEWHPWEDYRRSYAARSDLGGGALLTLCHPIDYMRWLLGDVDEAQGMLGEALGLEVEAVVEATLRFRSGLVGSVHLDYVQRPASHTLEIIGEEGFLRWDGRTGDLEIDKPAAGERQRHRPPSGFDRNDMFMAEMEHFLNVVNREASPACTLDDGIQVQSIIEKVRRSAREAPGRRRD